MPPGIFYKTRHFGDIQGGGLQTLKETLDTIYNMPRSLLSILNKLMLIMFMVFLLCGYVFLNSWTSLGYVVINLSLRLLKN